MAASEVRDHFVMRLVSLFTGTPAITCIAAARDASPSVTYYLGGARRIRRISFRSRCVDRKEPLPQCRASSCHYAWSF